jgi:HTH-type transcriptional regulator / antitoxin HipB
MQQLIRTPNQVAEIVRGRRLAKQLSQAALAKKLGISQGRMSTLESEPSGLTLERFLLLAKLLGLEVVIRDGAGAAKTKTEW